MTSVRELILKAVVGATYHVRNSRVGRTLHRSPLGDALKWGYRKTVDRLRGDRYHLTIGDVTAAFHAEDRETSRRLIHLKEEELPVLTDFVSTLEADDVVYDLGAHLGLYSCFALQVVEDGSVVAFEPFPPTAEELRHNCRLNGDATVVEAAISDATGTRKLHFETDETGNHKPHLEGTGERDSIDVETTTLDRYVAEGGAQPTVLKIDVEGTERQVLEGGDRTLASPELRAVYCELHPGVEEAGVVQTLQGVGFTLQEIDTPRQQKFLKAFR